MCGSGLVDAVAELVGAGLLDLSGRFVPNEQAAEIAPELSRRLLARDDGERIFVLHWQGDEGDVENAVYLSQRDVRELQFAKASIATGWSLLVEELGIDVSEIQQVLLAGSFGSYLSPASAVRIGLVPKLALPRIVSAGNVAGEGAKMALLSMQERHAATAMFDEVEYVELSDREDFNDRFVEQLAFPEAMSATLTVIYWRDIPAQVTAKGDAGSLTRWFSPADHRRDSGSGRRPCRNAGSGTVCQRCPRVDSRGGGGAGRSGPLLGDLCRRDAGRVRDDRRRGRQPRLHCPLSLEAAHRRALPATRLRYSDARPDRRVLPDRGGGTMWTSAWQARQPGHVLRAMRLRTNRRSPRRRVLLRLEISSHHSATSRQPRRSLGVAGLWSTATTDDPGARRQCRSSSRSPNVPARSG